MLLKREGFPEEDSLVLCTVTNIQYHSVFVRLDEFGSSGLIHISEISPGRIRNIRDYVVEGKKVVCKVLRIDRAKGHIDLSLRRVNDNQKRIKINEIKQEQKAEKIVEQIAKNNNQQPKDLYIKLKEKVFKKYDDLTSCFKEVVKKESLLQDLGISKDIADQLTEIIKVRFKEEGVEISGTLKLKSFEPDGIEIIKKSLQDAEKTDKKVSILYAGGGSYKVHVKSDKYKNAEKILDTTIKKALSFTQKGLGKGEFIRKEE